MCNQAVEELRVAESMQDGTSRMSCCRGIERLRAVRVAGDRDHRGRSQPRSQLFSQDPLIVSFKVRKSGKCNRCGGLPPRAYAFSACLSGAKEFLDLVNGRTKN
jgi:hypothetical protein